MRQLDKLLVLILTLFAVDTFSQNNNENKSSDIDTSFVLHFASYPMYALEMGLEGTVYATFDIDSTCTIRNIKITNSLCEKSCDETLIADIKRKKFI